MSKTGHTAVNPEGLGATELPAPRLQLRWEPTGDEQFQWRCHYELVLPLGEHDIRREIWKDGEEIGERSELVVPIKGPSRRDCERVPCASVEGSSRHYFDTPYRDGAHAKWDAALLGGLPIYVIAPDGTPIPQPTPGMNP